MKKLLLVFLLGILQADVVTNIYTIDKEDEAYRIGKYYPKLQTKRQEILNNCNKGNLVSCNNLGYLYINGIGFFKDKNRAWQIFNKSCESDLAVSCYNLSSLVNSKIQKQEYLKKACDLGDKFSCDLLDK